MSQQFSKEKREDKEVYPPDPPADPFPTEKAVVFGDASATYGSMVAPEVIRPASQLPVTGPLKKEKEATEKEHSKETKEAADHTVKAAQATVKELRAEQHSRDHKK